jgi:predicted RNase H-like HicB family nuclease
MPHRCAVEDIEPRHWIVWMLDLPACFSSAKTKKEALERAPDRIAQYYSWITDHDPSISVPEGPFEIEIVETFRSFACPEDPEYLVNAFFEDDRRPLTVWDVDVALRLFNWTRQDLQNVLESARPDQLFTTIDNEVHKSILGVVGHIAQAENWYFNHLDLGLEPSVLPEDVLERLEAVRENTHSQLVKLIGVDTIVEHLGEHWSPRKVVRRALWHERDHTQHIRKLLSALL